MDSNGQYKRDFRLVAALSGGGGEELRGAAAGTLANLAFLNAANQQAIAAAGAIPPLVAALRGGGGDTLRARAARALWTLTCNAANGQAVTAAGAIPPLVAALSGGGGEALYAAKALARLACGNAANQRAIVAAGAVPLLRSLRDGGSMDARVARLLDQLLAAETLASTPQPAPVEQSRECVICMTTALEHRGNDALWCIIPCMHQRVCRNCAGRLRELDDDPKCPLCRHKVSGPAGARGGTLLSAVLALNVPLGATGGRHPPSVLRPGLGSARQAGFWRPCPRLVYQQCTASRLWRLKCAMLSCIARAPWPARARRRARPPWPPVNCPAPA